MNHSEKVARATVEFFRPGCEMKFRPDQSNGEYDFDLICGDKKVAAIEVTMSTDEPKLQMQARIRKEMFVQGCQCKKGWLVNPHRSADPRKIRKHVDAYLAPIEAMGIEHFFSYTDAAENPHIDRILRDLRIDGGSVMEWTPPENRICINFPVDGGKVGLGILIDAIERVAIKDDNKKKLAKAGTECERHLFVYLDHNFYLPWVALKDTGALPPLSVLPQEMTHLWVVTETFSAENTYVAWVTEGGSLWQGPLYYSIEHVYLA